MAHSLNQLNHRVLSRPHEVRWAGFRSTTTEMQQSGWQLSADQDLSRNQIRLAFEHRELRIYGMSLAMEHDYYRHSEIEAYGARPLTFHVHRFACDWIVQTMDDLSNFAPIDARPTFVTSERKSLKDFHIFAAPLVRTEEIIVAPQDVQSLLDRIREIQVPEQAALREKQRKRATREGLMEPSPQQKFHAQILSMADYREAA